MPRNVCKLAENKIELLEKLKPVWYWSSKEIKKIKIFNKRYEELKEFIKKNDGL